MDERLTQSCRRPCAPLQPRPPPRTRSREVAIDKDTNLDAAAPRRSTAGACFRGRCYSLAGATPIDSDSGFGSVANSRGPSHERSRPVFGASLGDSEGLHNSPMDSPSLTASSGGSWFHTERAPSPLDRAPSPTSTASLSSSASSTTTAAAAAPALATSLTRSPRKRGCSFRSRGRSFSVVSVENDSGNRRQTQQPLASTGASANATLQPTRPHRLLHRSASLSEHQVNAILPTPLGRRENQQEDLPPPRWRRTTVATTVPEPRAALLRRSASERGSALSAASTLQFRYEGLSLEEEGEDHSEALSRLIPQELLLSPHSGEADPADSYRFPLWESVRARECPSSSASCRASDMDSPWPLEAATPQAPSTAVVESCEGGPRQWSVGKELGRGTYGRVFQALNLDTGELFAVKTILLRSSGSAAPSPSGDAALDEDFVRRQRVRDRAHARRLQSEMAVMRALRHENVVPFLGCSADPERGLLHIFLELVPGGSLRDLYKRHGRVAPQLLAKFTLHMTRGVAYLHSENILHRDIKAANVLISAGGVAMLSDFGASRQLSLLDPADGTLDELRGSVPWMSPEVIQQKGASFAADVWALGCTVLEAGAARMPWSSAEGNVATLIFRIGNATAPPELPESFKGAAVGAFASRCLAMDPEDRPTALDLLDDPFLLDT